MKRYALRLLILSVWLALIAAACAQSTSGAGWPPQSSLFNDALFMARAAPFIIAAGIVVGIIQARAAARTGGDAIVGELVRRHDTGTILAHWLNVVGVFTSLVTGAMVLRWVDRGVDLRLAFIIHFVGGSLILFAIFNHLTRHGVAGGTAMIPKSWRVIRDVIGELLEYAGLYGPKWAALHLPIPKSIRVPVARYVGALLGYKPAQAGKYLPTEQLLSYLPWAIWLGLIVVTGLIKVMRYVYPMPSTFIATVTAIHDLTALIIGVSIIIHLLPLLLVPANWPLLLSMFKTTVPRKYAEERHPVWYQELLAKRKVREVPVSETRPERSPAQTTSDVSSGD